MASESRVIIEMSDLESKYSVESPPVPCTELIPICGARCCSMHFTLQTEDLDEGVIRWDYGRPYKIRQRASDGKCVHNDPTSGHCTVHQHRPKICRKYDCRNDKRIWIDFEKRIPVPLELSEPPPDDDEDINLVEILKKREHTIKARELGEMMESMAVAAVYPEEEPQTGPSLTPRKPALTARKRSL